MENFISEKTVSIVRNYIKTHNLISFQSESEIVQKAIYEFLYMMADFASPDQPNYPNNVLTENGHFKDSVKEAMLYRVPVDKKDQDQLMKSIYDDLMQKMKVSEMDLKVGVFKIDENGDLVVVSHPKAPKEPNKESFVKARAVRFSDLPKK